MKKIKQRSIVGVRMENERMFVIEQAIESIDKEMRELSSERIALERVRARCREDAMGD